MIPNVYGRGYTPAERALIVAMCEKALMMTREELWGSTVSCLAQSLAESYGVDERFCVRMEVMRN